MQLHLIKHLKSGRESSPGSTGSATDESSDADRIWGTAYSTSPHSPEDVVAFTALNFGPTMSSSSKSSRKRDVRREVVEEDNTFEMEMDEEPVKRSRVKCECNEESCDACRDERLCFEALSLLSEVALSVPNTPIIAPSCIPASFRGFVPMSV